MSVASFISTGTSHAILNGFAFFAFVLWLCLGVWTYRDARRRIEDPLLVGLSTLLTALATSVAGVVGFVGLVVPHLLRLCLGPDHRRLLPASMMGGAALTLACDVATRVLPGGLRLGIVTAFVGGPFFLWMLRTLA